MANVVDLSRLSLFQGLSQRMELGAQEQNAWLRRCSVGEVICRQGDRGNTAFYLLTSDDVSLLGESVLPVDGAHSLPRRLATAHLLVNVEVKPMRRGFWPFGKQVRHPANQPAYLPHDGPGEMDYKTRQSALFEGDLFGETSCLTAAPRSATVVADGNCQLLEFSRTILEQLNADATHRRRMDEVYRRRALLNHLRQLESLRELNDETLLALGSRAELFTARPGQVICRTGEPADAVYLVRRGTVREVAGSDPVDTRAETIDWQALCRDLLPADEQGPPGASA